MSAHLNEILNGALLSNRTAFLGAPPYILIASELVCHLMWRSMDPRDHNKVRNSFTPPNYLSVSYLIMRAHLNEILNGALLSNRIAFLGGPPYNLIASELVCRLMWRSMDPRDN